MSNDNVFKLVQPGTFDDQLTEILRQGARSLLAQAVEAEVADFLAKHADLKTADGRQRIVRHGHLPKARGHDRNRPCHGEFRAGLAGFESTDSKDAPLRRVDLFARCVRLSSGTHHEGEPVLLDLGNPEPPLDLDAVNSYDLLTFATASKRLSLVIGG